MAAPVNRIQLIAGVITQQIADGQYQGRLPNMPTLAREFGASVKTINKAVGMLVDEGLVYKVSNTGMYIREPEPGTCRGTVAFLVYAEGHVHKDLALLMTRKVQERHFTPLLFTPTEGQHLYDACNTVLAHLGVSRHQALVALGGIFFPYDTLSGMRSQFHQLVFLSKQATPLPIAATWISPDYRQGGYLATTHLLRAGHRRIALLDHLFWEPPHLYPCTASYDLNMGYRQALAEWG